LKYYVNIYDNGTMRALKLFLKEGRRGKGERWRGWI
jgi:hypothetical protein